MSSYPQVAEKTSATGLKFVHLTLRDGDGPTPVEIHGKLPTGEWAMLNRGVLGGNSEGTNRTADVYIKQHQDLDEFVPIKEVRVHAEREIGVSYTER